MRWRSRNQGDAATSATRVGTFVSVVTTSDEMVGEASDVPALGPGESASRAASMMSPTVPDVMGYCGPGGISDYHFANALRWRLHDEVGVGAYYAGPPTQALLLWGTVGADGGPFLNPAFVVDGRPSLLDEAGAWRIVGEACACSGLGVGGRSVANRVDGPRRHRGHERGHRPGGGTTSGPGHGQSARHSG